MMAASVLLLVTCGKNELEADYVDGTTDAYGEVTLSVGNHEMTVQVMDTTGLPISGIFVRGMLLDEDEVLIVTNDPNGVYYPEYTLYLPSQAFGNGTASIQSVEAIPIVIPIVLTVVGIGMSIYDHYIDGDFQSIQVSPFVVKHTMVLEISDAFSIFGFAGGWGQIGRFVGLSSSVRDILNVGVSGARLGFSALGNFDEVRVLFQNYFNIMEHDLMSIEFYYILVGDFEIPTGFMWISDIQLNRDFDYKLTLTWGADPSDLDSHLWTPLIQGQTYHIYFADQGSQTSPPYAELDHDDVTSYGPENLTIKQLCTGTYQYAIYHYAGSGTITTSGAEIRIFDESGLVQTLNVPNVYSESNWWWYVCDIDGSTGTITIVNQISLDPPGFYEAGAPKRPK